MRRNLASRITWSTLGVILIALFNGILGMLTAYHYRDSVERVANENLASVRAAEELEIALLEQRGYVSSHLLEEGRGEWLTQLEQKRRQFGHWLAEARATAHTERETSILDQLESAQAAHDAERDQILNLYRLGNVDEATHQLLHRLPLSYDRAYQLCEEFIAVNDEYAKQTSTQANAKARGWVWLLVASGMGSLLLGGVLLWTFLYGIVLPLRRMAAEARDATSTVESEASGHDASRDDELGDIRRYTQLLMSDVAQARKALGRSHELLARSERLAAVGKLAASVAHEIRNPLTAIKMWLYSLRRETGGEADLRRQFDAISDEIGRLENIIQSFLEFSRPPALRLGHIDVAQLVEKTHELLRARLAGVNVDFQCRVDDHLPQIVGDSDQLRQVLLNLLNNSLDAMPDGGTIEVTAKLELREKTPFVVVGVKDTGLGLSDEARAKLFAPFFSTKEQGTGLGLSVAAAIIARHDGLIDLESSSSRGTQFAVWLPVQMAEPPYEQDSHRR